ncbi:MAG: DUF2480 family protein [Cyclobacteriaceae bacterium]|nr:DUF2480 family protein [Cyclobacteriaceae bacterium]
METEKEIMNRVLTSSLVTFDLEEYFQPGDRVQIDVRDLLFQDLIIKEKDFREHIKSHNWSQYQDKLVAVYCSIDAIIPTWAYMLLAIALEPFARKIVFGDLHDLEEQLYKDELAKVNWSVYQDAKVVVKGCSKVDVPLSAYVEVTNKLRPIAASLMFGEPCSTVPLYKRKQ